MNYEIYISPEAHNDILNIFKFISTDDLTAAKKEIDIIYLSIENLMIFPEMGFNLREYTYNYNDYKCLNIQKKYIIIYKIVNNIIQIIRIFNHKQDYIKLLNII